MQEYRNIYQISRESAGLTQEKAAELIGVSTGSLQSYEQGRRCPSNIIVAQMIGIYGGTYLAYQHIQASSAGIGENILPEFEIRDLPASILKLQKEVNDFLRCRDELIDITCDGKIIDVERPRWEAILKELDDIAAAIMSVKFSKNKGV